MLCRDQHTYGSNRPAEKLPIVPFAIVFISLLGLRIQSQELPKGQRFLALLYFYLCFAEVFVLLKFLDMLLKPEVVDLSAAVKALFSDPDV